MSVTFVTVTFVTILNVSTDSELIHLQSDIYSSHSRTCSVTLIFGDSMYAGNSLAGQRTMTHRRLTCTVTYILIVNSVINWTGFSGLFPMAEQRWWNLKSCYLAQSWIYFSQREEMPRRRLELFSWTGCNAKDKTTV